MRTPRWVVLLVGIACACCSAGTALDGRITISKAFPVIGEPVTVGLRMWGAPGVEGRQVSFSVTSPGRSIDPGTVELIEQDDGTWWCGVELQPPSPGMYTLRAAVGTATYQGHLTVIERPMHFIWYGSHESLRYATAVTPPPKDAALKQHLRDNGVAVLDWKGIGRSSVEVTADYWGAYEHDGIAIDEIGLYDHSGPEGQYSEKALTALKALAPFKQAHPDGFLAVWNAGSLTPLSANYYRQSADVVMLECYLNFIRAGFGSHSFKDYLDQRIQMARRMDVLDKCIIALGITRDRGGVTPAEIINQIEYCRLAAPECPGIAWFLAGGEQRVDSEVLRIADEAAYTYFIKPCLMVRDWDMGFVPGTEGKPGKLTVDVHNIGALDASGLNVAFYLGHPEQGGQRIGSTYIPGIHAPQGWSKALDELPSDELINRAYGVVEASVEWLSAPGSYEVYARIHADRREHTLLSDLAHKRVIVR